MTKNIKILLGHSFPDKEAFGEKWIDSWLARLRTSGIEVFPFSLVIDQQRPVIYYNELDILWRYKDHKLLTMYEKLGTTLSDYDAFICFNGSNVHPDFVSGLDCFTVYACFDDPESSEKLSKPVANAFDLVMVGNIAEVDTYRSWGVQEAQWWPLGFRHDDYDSKLTALNILNKSRDIEVALMCERLTRYRKKRLDSFVKAFPKGLYRGLGWPEGFLPEKQRIQILQRTKIGINIHNSTGPINFRTFYLPANGVLQLCDNKSNLAKVFEVGKEVIGYDTIEEAIELTQYYLNHDYERRKIASEGWKRAITDYNEVACFNRVINAINEKRDNLILNKKKNKMYTMLDKRNITKLFFDRIILFFWKIQNKVILIFCAKARIILNKIF